MKKEQRLVYRELSSEVDTQLCSFCKDSESLGCCGGMACIHPLNEEGRLVGGYDGLFPYDDCFLYRPNLSVWDIADIVGVILSNGFMTNEWSYAVYPKGIKVFGTVPIKNKGGG